MVEVRPGRLIGVMISSLMLIACGGGGGGGSTAPTTAVPSSSSASSMSVPAKTAPEAFYDIYGVKPGIYEMTFKSPETTVITQARILANETSVGGVWGFLPYFEICNDVDEGVLPNHFGTSMRNGDLPKGQIYYQPLNSNFGDDVILTVDATNPNVLTGTRFNEINAEKENITMRWVSGEKDYSEGTVDLTTSISGLESINSSSVCYSSRSEVVDYGDGVSIVENNVFINILKKRVTNENPGMSGDRIAGIRIAEDTYNADKKDNAFFILFLQKGVFDKELIPHQLVNEKKDEFGMVVGAITHATSADALSFTVDVKGNPGTEAAGFFVRGSITLKPK